MKAKNCLMNLMTTYFSSIVLFYLYQIIFIENTYRVIFKNYYKSVPFLLATFFLWSIIFLYFLKNFISNKSKNNFIIIINVLTIMILFLFIINRYVKFIVLNYSKDLVIAYFSFAFIILTVIIILLTDKIIIQNILSVFKMYPVILIFIFIPVLHLASVNYDYIFGILYYFYYFGLFVIVGIINLIWFSFFSYNKISHSSLVVSISIFSFLFFSLPILRSIFSLCNSKDYEFLILLFFIFGIFYLFENKFTLKNFSTFGLLVLLVFFTFFVININYETSSKMLKVETVKLPELLLDIEFEVTPNIYLFVYDGLPNERVFNFLELPYFDKIKELLYKYNFVLYDDAYSIKSDSLRTMSRVLNISDNSHLGYDATMIYSGKSVVNKILRKNGYKTYKILGNYFVRDWPFILKDYYVEEYYPKRVASWIVKFDFLAVLIRGIFQGELKFDTKGLSHFFLNLFSSAPQYNTLEQEQKIKLDLIKRNKNQSFIVNHLILPGHTSSRGRLYPDDREKWIEDLKNAIIQMEKDFKAIEFYDPNSIVIAMADHGPFLIGDGFRLEGYDKSEITLEMVWDRVGTLLAIRWPDRERASKFDSDLVTVQEIFPVIFSHLSNNPKYLELKPSRLFRSWFFDVKFKDGNMF